MVAFTSGNVPEKHDIMSMQEPSISANPGGINGTSDRSSVSSWYYFSKHYSTYLQIVLIQRDASSSLVSPESGGLGTLETVVRLHASG